MINMNLNYLSRHPVKSALMVQCKVRQVVSCLYIFMETFLLIAFLIQYKVNFIDGHSTYKIHSVKNHLSLC